MKHLLILSILSTSMCALAAEKQMDCNATDEVSALGKAVEEVREKVQAGDCPPPKASDYMLLCGDLITRAKVSTEESEIYEFSYEKRLWNLSCAKPPKKEDDELAKDKARERAKEQITSMWNKYRTQFKCDSSGFNVQNGSILKYSLLHSVPDFIETLVINYDLDINFVDPADNRNVLDYLNDEIKRLNRTGATKDSIRIYEKYKEEIVSLGAKPSKP